MNDLLTHWADDECPLLNGVTFNDGTHYSITAVEAPRGPLPLRLSHTGPQPLADLAPFQWTSVNGLCHAESPSGELKAVAGEGGWGGDGVIALLNTKRAPQWVAFFDCSNPFVHLRFDGADVVATNNMNEEWRLPVERPWQITITPAEKASDSSVSYGLD